MDLYVHFSLLYADNFIGSVLSYQVFTICKFSPTSSYDHSIITIYATLANTSSCKIITFEFEREELQGNWVNLQQEQPKVV